MIANAHPLATKLRTLASGLDKEIRNKLGPRQENTNKRQREAAIARYEGRHMQRAQRALNALADAHEMGTCPEILKDLKTKAEILPMLKTGARSQSYYEFIDTDEFTDTSPRAVALRQLMDSQVSAAEQEELERQKRAHELRELESRVRNVKIDGFFPTPQRVAEIMFDVSSYSDGGIVLEPSAGAGHLADAVMQRYPGSSIICCERNFTLVEILEAKGYPVYRGDFLEQPPEPVFDAVFMNPPFEKLADTEHIRHAFQFLKPGGELLSVASKSFTFRSDRKSEQFRDWLASLGEHADLPEGAFSGSDAFRQTGVNTCLVRVLKPR